MLRYHRHSWLCEQYQAAGKQSTYWPGERPEPVRTCWMANRRWLQVSGRFFKTGQTLHAWSSNPVWWFSSEIIVHVDQIFHCPVWFLEGKKNKCRYFSWINGTSLAASNGTWGMWKTSDFPSPDMIYRWSLLTESSFFGAEWPHWGWIQGRSIVNARCMRRATLGFRRAPLISGAPASSSPWMGISNRCCIRSSSPGVALARGWLPPAVNRSTRRNGVGQNMSMWWHLPGPYFQREPAVLNMVSRWDKACPWSPSCWVKCCPCWASEETEACRGRSFGIPSTTCPLSWTFAWCFSWSTAGKSAKGLESLESESQMAVDVLGTSNRNDHRPRKTVGFSRVQKIGQLYWLYWIF